MKKFAAGAGAAALAVSGLAGLSIAPAAAAPFVYDNCAEVYADGKSHLTVGDAGYHSGLDGSDNDGVGCEGGGGVPQPRPVTPKVDTPEVTAPQSPVADPAAPVAPQAPEAEQPWAWDNCSEAFANGVSNIPAGAPGYGTHLDSDLDGIGCELNGDDDTAFPTPVVTDDDDSDDQADDAVAVDSDDDASAGTATGSQVAQVPTGAADTGVAVQQSSNNGLLAGAAALAIAGLGGAGLLARRAVRA